jgi:hypothetical protein
VIWKKVLSAWDMCSENLQDWLYKYAGGSSSHCLRIGSHRVNHFITFTSVMLSWRASSILSLPIRHEGTNNEFFSIWTVSNYTFQKGQYNVLRTTSSKECHNRHNRQILHLTLSILLTLWRNNDKLVRTARSKSYKRTCTRCCGISDPMNSQRPCEPGWHGRRK